MIIWEIKKILKAKSFWVNIILLIFIVVVMSILKPTLETKNSYYNTENEYVIDERLKHMIANEKLVNKVTQLKKISELKNFDSEKNEIGKISKLAEEKLEKDDGKVYENIDFYKVFNFRIANGITSIIITIMIILILSNIYTDEKLLNMDCIILSSKNRNITLYSKLALAVIVPTVIYGVYILTIGIITDIQYEGFVNGNLQAYRMVDIPTSLCRVFTLNEYTGITIATMLLLYIIVSLFSSFSSFITKDSVSSIVVSIIFLIAFKVLMLINGLPEDVLKILQKTNFVDLYMNPQMLIGIYEGEINILGNSLDIIGMCYGILLGLLLIATACNIYVFKKVLNK